MFQGQSRCLAPQGSPPRAISMDISPAGWSIPPCPPDFCMLPNCTHISYSRNSISHSVTSVRNGQRHYLQDNHCHWQSNPQQLLGFRMNSSNLTSITAISSDISHMVVRNNMWFSDQKTLSGQFVLTFAKKIHPFINITQPCWQIWIKCLGLGA